MNSRFFIGLGIGFVLLSGARAAHADLTFSFEFDRSNYVAAPSGLVDVQVFLRQTGIADSGQTNILGGPEAVGMTGTGVRVTFGTGPNDAQVLSELDITGNAAFDNFGFPPFTSVSSGSAILSQSTSGAPVLGTNVALDTYDLLLGTFTFTAGTVLGQMTTISASIPLSPNSNDNLAATSPDHTVLTNIESAADDHGPERDCRARAQQPPFGFGRSRVGPVGEPGLPVRNTSLGSTGHDQSRLRDIQFLLVRVWPCLA